ncbi:BCCT family transporter [Amphritea sp. 2_MG-2023]|uniref:BCCT family transporter n=1 Tax=Amphritea TaxID=515417 RepID=UPI001C078191|nr:MULTISPECIES: BCCT family transporter [Amphritea]MBU2967095.1 BCCT family transporter [Amphritea atlantica]MDO6419352.1 BCCT family transporter [Amphritea sp. 2_MG-2023]
MIIASVAIPIIAFPEAAKVNINVVFKWMTNTFDFAFLSIGLAALIFLLSLAFSRHGSIKLSADKDAAPEFSKGAWGAMVFLAGIASGLVLWGGTEWGYHYAWTPFGLEAKSLEMYTVAQGYGIFHWGPTAWALYCVPTIAISYIYYVRKKHIYKVSESCRGALGNLVDGPLGTIINYTFIFGVLGAAATSLGLGTPMISGALAEVLGVSSGIYMDMTVILVCTAIFSVSSGLGLSQGIKRLSTFSTLLTLAIVAYILVVGPTKFIIGLGMDSLGYALENYIKMSTWTDSVNKSGFPQAWTVFYWAWWVAYAPFMGMFVTRISRGRTIREVITGMLTYGSLGCALFYMVLGGYGINLQMTDVLQVSELVNSEGVATAIIEIFKTLPASGLILLCVAASGIVLLATTFDSAAYVMACTTTKELDEGQEPERSNRLFWCFAIAILPLTLMFLGGLKSMQTASVLVGLPVMAILVLMMITTIKYINEDNA